MWALELIALEQLDGACFYRTRRYRARHNHFDGATACRERVIRPDRRIRRGRLSWKLLGSSMELALVA